jgi:DNA-binding PadR family transcriptional regulator
MRSTRHVVEKEPEFGHFSNPTLLVLASLAGGPKHGHAMIQDIAILCGSRLGPGTLYGAITRLEAQGWIEPLPAEDRRRPYRISTAGLQVLRASLATLHQFTEAGLKRLEAL